MWSWGTGRLSEMRELDGFQLWKHGYRSVIVDWLSFKLCHCHPLSEFLEARGTSAKCHWATKMSLTSSLLCYLPCFRIMAKELSGFLLFGLLMRLNFFPMFIPFLWVLFSSILSICISCFSNLYDCLRVLQKTWLTYAKKNISSLSFSFSNLNKH